MFRDNTYLVGTNVTVADLCTVTNVSQMEYILPIDDEQYSNVRSWLKRMAKLPYFNELNTKILSEFGQALAKVFEKNKAALRN